MLGLVAAFTLLVGVGIGAASPSNTTTATPAPVQTVEVPGPTVTVPGPTVTETVPGPTVTKTAPAAPTTPVAPATLTCEQYQDQVDTLTAGDPSDLSAANVAKYKQAATIAVNHPQCFSAEMVESSQGLLDLG